MTEPISAVYLKEELEELEEDEPVDYWLEELDYDDIYYEDVDEEDNDDESTDYTDDTDEDYEDEISDEEIRKHLKTKRSKREPADKNQFPEMENNTQLWTYNEKKKFLIAVMTHGSSNITQLAQCVPTKTESAIKEFIMYNKKKCHYMLKTKVVNSTKKRSHSRKTKKENVKNTDSTKNIPPAPIEKWRDLIAELDKSDNFSRSDISRAVKYIALFEQKTDEHISLSDCYEVLSDILRGEAPKQLSPENSLFLLKNYQRLARVMMKEINTNEEEYLKKFAVETKKQKPAPKTYGSKKKATPPVLEPTVEIDETLNPLKVPLSLLNVKLFN